MSMQVGGLGSDRLNGVYASAAPVLESANGTNRSRGSAGPSDSVTLSGGVQDFKIAQKAVGDLPDVREDRVAELKARIDAGTYNPSPESIAASMLGI